MEIRTGIITYQNGVGIEETVSPAYLDLRTQLWQREVEGAQ